MSSVMQAVNEKERKAQEGSLLRTEGIRLLGIAAGVCIYAVGVNVFLRPLHLYSGGFMGFSQLCSYLLQRAFGRGLKFDLAGFIYYLLNIPALLLAWRIMRRRFVIKTILTVTMITAALTLVPIPSQPVLDEVLANAVISGILAGIGVGFMLRMGSCDGGMDLIGMILIQTKGRFSVGRINIAANIILYAVFLLLFDIPTAIYSMIYSVVCSTACDRVHTQNINVQAMIVTKMPDASPLEIELMGQMTRGLTRWKANGSYTGEPVTVLMAVISKYEIAQLKSIVHAVDPHAFVMIDEGVSVDGNFLKKIT